MAWTGSFLITTGPCVNGCLVGAECTCAFLGKWVSGMYHGRLLRAGHAKLNLATLALSGDASCLAVRYWNWVTPGVAVSQYL